MGHLRLRWDAESQILFVRRDGSAANRPLGQDEMDRLRALLSTAPGYAVLLDAAGLPESSYNQKASWFLFVSSIRHPRKLAVHSSEGGHTRAIDVFGSLVRVPTRFFRSEQEALAWLKEP